MSLHQGSQPPPGEAIGRIWYGGGLAQRFRRLQLMPLEVSEIAIDRLAVERGVERFERLVDLRGFLLVKQSHGISSVGQHPSAGLGPIDQHDVHTPLLAPDLAKRHEAVAFDDAHGDADAHGLAS